MYLKLHKISNYWANLQKNRQIHCVQEISVKFRVKMVVFPPISIFFALCLCLFRPFTLHFLLVLLFPSGDGNREEREDGEIKKHQNRLKKAITYLDFTRITFLVQIARSKQIHNKFSTNPPSMTSISM